MSKKKIYDIIPPEKKKEILGQNKEILKKKSIKKIEKIEKKNSIIFSKKRIFVGLFLFLFVILIYWFFSTANVINVDISPKLDILTFDTSILYSTSTAEFILSPVDLSKTIIPAIPFEIEKTFNKEFASAEVAVEEKAQGTIRVYNEHSRTISLIEGTRFLSSSEPTKQFHAQEKIIIPQGGFVDVPVIASESGEDYNIESCTFSVPGLRNFSPPQLYFDIYGKSFAKMEGGRKDIAHKITKEALENAKQKLLEIADQEIVTFLDDAAGEDYKIFSDNIELKIIEANLMNREEGEEADSFVYEVKVKANCLKVALSSLLEFAQEYVFSNLPGHKDFVRNAIDVGFLTEQGSGVEKLNTELRIVAKTYSKIDEDSLKELIKGRNKKEISRYSLEVCPELLKAPSIKFSPFWARRASSEPESIEIGINF